MLLSLCYQHSESDLRVRCIISESLSDFILVKNDTIVNHKETQLINRVDDILVPEFMYSGILKCPLKLKTS